MPINSCSDGGSSGYKWGDSGKCYTYTAGDKASRSAAREKARMQGVAARLNGYVEKSENEEEVYNLVKSLTEWFNERWVDISRPKPDGGYESCGRSDASSGKYPKCVPASRAARMTPAEIRSAVQRKRRAESTQTREDKKPINVSTIKKIAEDLAEEEAMLAMALVSIAQRYGKFNEDATGIWAGYEPAEENDDAEIGVKCANCILYQGDGVCKILAQQVEDEGKCRFAIIPDGVVQMEDDEMEDEDEMEEKVEMEDESNGEMEDEMEDEDPDDMLSPIQQAQYEALEAIAEKFGKWDQSAGANGAHYANEENNPFKEAGMVCANCVFYEGGRGCEIVEGEIEPNAICKLWIINEKYITE